VSISADGKRVFAGVLKKNEKKLVSVKESTRIRTGNAGALAITWNGKPLPAVGRRGQVRTVLLTPDRVIASAGSM
jgi:hypothetical protein